MESCTGTEYVILKESLIKWGHAHNVTQWQEGRGGDIHRATVGQGTQRNVTNNLSRRQASSDFYLFATLSIMSLIFYQKEDTDVYENFTEMHYHCKAFE